MLESIAVSHMQICFQLHALFLRRACFYFRYRVGLAWFYLLITFQFFYQGIGLGIT